MPDASPSAAQLASLRQAAAAAASRAYAPYSNFRVGAALLLESGAVITGVNVENSSYGLTVCAERAAVVCAVSEHGPSIHIVAVAVANLNGGASAPCGACRQVLSEFMSPDALVLFPGPNGDDIRPFGELQPLAFRLT